MVAPQPSIYIGSLRIDEPITTLTSLMVAGVGFYGYLQLRKKKEQNIQNTLLRRYLLWLGIATALGGLIGHAFMYWFSGDSDVVSPWKLPGWLSGILAVHFGERAAIEYTRPILTERTSKLLERIVVIELIVFASLTILSLNFLFVAAQSAFGLVLIVTSLHLLTFLKLKSTASRQMITGVGMATVSVIIFLAGWALSKWFNHMDISHIFMAIAVYYFFLSALNTHPITTTGDKDFV